MECLYCKFETVIRDNHDDLHCICTCAESENFLTKIDLVFCQCDFGEKEDD